MFPLVGSILVSYAMGINAVSFSDMYDTSLLKPGLNDSVLCYAKVHGVTQYSPENSRWIGVEMRESIVYPIIVSKDCSIDPLTHFEFDALSPGMPNVKYSPSHDYCADLHAQLLKWADDRVALGRERIYPIPLNVGPIDGKTIEEKPEPFKKPSSMWMTWLPLLFSGSLLYWRNMRRRKNAQKAEDERKERELAEQDSADRDEDESKHDLVKVPLPSVSGTAEHT